VAGNNFRLTTGLNDPRYRMHVGNRTSKFPILTRFVQMPPTMDQPRLKFRGKIFCLERAMPNKACSRYDDSRNREIERFLPRHNADIAGRPHYENKKNLSVASRSSSS